MATALLVLGGFLTVASLVINYWATKRTRPLTIVLFLGIAGTLLSSVQGYSSHLAQEELLGGNNSVIVTALPRDRKDTKASFPLFIVNEQSLPVYDVTLQIINIEKVHDITENGHESTAELFNEVFPKSITVGTVPRMNAGQTRVDNVALPVGTYQINITTRRGYFRERLWFWVENGEVREGHEGPDRL